MPDAEVGSGLDPLTIFQQSGGTYFQQWVTLGCAQMGKKICKVIKCKLMDKMEGQFDLVEVLLVEGDTLTHWQEITHIKTMHTSKNMDRLNTHMKGVCPEMFKVHLQELKKHSIPKNLVQFQKFCLCNHGKIE
eukprot:4817960-Ditylum_brightwellii.AAC.1